MTIKMIDVRCSDNLNNPGEYYTIDRLWVAGHNGIEKIGQGERLITKCPKCKQYIYSDVGEILIPSFFEKLFFWRKQKAITLKHDLVCGFCKLSMRIECGQEQYDI
jgi:hypothetical protein